MLDSAITGLQAGHASSVTADNPAATAGAADGLVSSYFNGTSRTLALSVNGKTQTITIASAQANLAALESTINARHVGVTASGTTGLTLTSTATGSHADVTLLSNRPRINSHLG
jgi:hypothetical protein